MVRFSGLRRMRVLGFGTVYMVFINWLWASLDWVLFSVVGLGFKLSLFLDYVAKPQPWLITSNRLMNTGPGRLVC